MQSRLADSELRASAAQDAADAADKRSLRSREAAAASDAKLRGVTAENSEVRSHRCTAASVVVLGEIRFDAVHPGS